MADQDTPPPTITAMKIPIIKKGEYDIWSMRMRQYICHTDHNLWDIIVNGDLEDEATPSGEQSSPPVPKTAKQLAARRNQERIKSILLLAIPDEYLLKFHNVPDAKSLWAAIKSRFGDIDEVDIDDLYNNLRVYEDELKRSSGSNSASQNLAFLSSDNTNTTNEVSTASGDIGVSTGGGINQHMDGDDLEELDLRWQVAIQRLNATTVIEKDILLENVDLEGVKEEDLMVKIAGAMHKQLTHLRPLMSTHDKNGLGFGTQMDDLSNKSKTDSENSLTVFEVRSSDEESTLANNKFTKASEYHAVPPPITGNPLTPRADISFAGLDEYAFRNKIIESETTETNKTVGTTNEPTIVKPKSVNETFVSKSKINRDQGNPEILLQDHAVVDSGCSSHMTGNKAYLSDYEDFNGGFMAFGSDPKGGKITGKGKIKTANLDFDDCDKKNSVLFTESECLILSPSFKLLDESQVVLRAPRKDGVYSLDLKNIVPSGDKRRIASQKKAAQATSTNQLSTVRPFVSTGRSSVSTDRSNTPNVSAASTSTGANADKSSFVYLGGKIPIDATTLPNADLPIDPNMPDLEDVTDTLPNDGIFNGAYDDDEDVGAVADFNNMDNTIAVSPIPTLRIHKDHPKGQILGDPSSAVQTRGKIQKASSAQQALVSYIHKQNRTNHKDQQNYLFACFLSQEEPKTISQALKDESWVEAMQEELLQFKLQQVWILVDLPFRKKANLLFLALKSEAIRRSKPLHHIRDFFLVYSSKWDVKSAFLYDIIEEEVSYAQKIPDEFHGRAYILFGTTATTPIESNKPLVKDEDGVEVDVHEYRSMIGSLMYLTASRPNIMFAVCGQCNFKRVHMAQSKGTPTANMVAWVNPEETKESVGFTGVRTLANGTQQLVAFIDSKEYTITEESVRGKLQLADATGIHNLSDAEIYAGLATLGKGGGDTEGVRDRKAQTERSRGVGSCRGRRCMSEKSCPIILLIDIQGRGQRIKRQALAEARLIHTYAALAQRGTYEYATQRFGRGCGAHSFITRLGSRMN
ncbi:hypothetical protein Tco_0215080 [Tanacetum coccineum]